MASSTIPYQPKTVIAYPYTGDYRIDVMLYDLSKRWSKPGEAVTLTYSFTFLGFDKPAPGDPNGYSQFTEQQRIATREILKTISSQVGITFVEKDEAKGETGVIRFGNSYQKDSLGETQVQIPVFASVYLNGYDVGGLTDFVPGEQNYATLIHEIGHALGLKHPGDYNGFSGSSNQKGNYLASSEDTTLVSIMSYISGPQKQERDYFGKFDVLALRYLYGKVEYKLGDDTYVYSDSDGAVLKLIVDDGGVDTINVSNVTTGAKLDLTPGANSSFGMLPTKVLAKDNLSVAFDAKIENVIGTAFNDSVVLNNEPNQIDGGAGVDTVKLAGSRLQVQMSKSVDANGKTVLSIADQVLKTNVDKLTGVETIQFNDMIVDTTAAEIARTLPAATVQKIVELYIAYFNRVPDGGGMAYWMTQYKNGATIEKIGESFYFIAVSSMFSALTGYSSSMTNETFVRTIYKNVLGRNEVDQEGLNYWTNALSLPAGTKGAETRGTLIDTILNAAHSFKGKADYGFVADLLDNKFTVGKFFALDQGLSYLTPEETYTKAVLISEAVTPTDTQAALKLIGISDMDFAL
ncbi:DUF4214 domain-containing protein [Undibacterium cyanobacteriorum]|uniref:DUF4214 domain-containing protein n=1 Tax=Undibacterium cyanobacteriorum TaxID=3073561 RepID=A0ABY9RP02_9BURK|nr:DUF4214 domain-containing protein [Undibacterium sp. 20NA77.5]WMW82410.1 DUF4214 domain-containing protein [Undibacterium sp. 20NA77.5]